MVNKRIVISFALIIILLITITILYKHNNNKEYFESNGVLLSISDGNGNTLSNVPDKGLYEVTVDCNNAEGSWDYDKWRIIVSNITGNVTCDLTFSSVSKTQTFAQYIVSLAGTTQGTGKLVNENGYRYEGKDPNNYIWYNNEMWRIIGVFGSNRHGVSSTNLVKIMRAESIAGLSWNGVSGYSNNWPNTTLYKLLNGCYFYAKNPIETTDIFGNNDYCQDFCKGYYAAYDEEPSSNCLFGVFGLQNDGLDVGYRDMVQTVTWYLGGPTGSTSAEFYPANLYSIETDSSSVYSGNSTSVTANVGLMYLSDYAYSVLASSCARGSYLVNYNSNVGSNASLGYGNSICSGNSWIYGQGYEWTITPNGDSNRVWRVTENGYVHMHAARNGYSVRPVVYLKANTYKLDGTGSKTDPYIVGKEYEYSNTFNYSSSVQTLSIAKAGYYKLEVYGAAGGTYNSATPGGAGGYAKGTIHLNKNDTLYIHTGGIGSYGSSTTMTTKNGGGTNGGGNASYRGGGGGGATDIRINTDSLYARVIVGGGGGGSYYYSSTYKAAGGNGGGTSGSNGAYYSSSYSAFVGKGGSSTAGGAGGTSSSSAYNGTAGSFGNGGASGRAYSTSYYSGGGGGGGWYGGGGAGNYNGQSRNRAAGGGGGSSYTYTSSTASQCPSGCLLTSEYYMTSTSTTAGSNTGNGYAKVTYCGQSASDCS